MKTVLRGSKEQNDRPRTVAAHGALISHPRLASAVLNLNTLRFLEGRVLVQGEEEYGRDAGRSYFMMEGTDARVYDVPHSVEIEQARSEENHKTNPFVRLRKQFVDRQPLLEIEGLGPAETILQNKLYMKDMNQIVRGLLSGVRPQSSFPGVNPAVFSGTSSEQRPDGPAVPGRLPQRVASCFALQTVEGTDTGEYFCLFFTNEQNPAGRFIQIRGGRAGIIASATGMN